MTSKGGPKFPTTPIARLTGHGGPVHAVTYSATTAQYVRPPLVSFTLTG
jgi:mitogen-activated protein kinase organizer 1